MKYIPLDAVVAEIERFIERAKAERVLYPKTILAAKNYLLIEDYTKLLSFLKTLEVKEISVDLGDPKGDKSTKYVIDTKNLEVKEVDIDAMVVEYHNALISQDKHHLLTTNAIKGHCEVYRKGLQDMYSLIKGE